MGETYRESHIERSVCDYAAGFGWLVYKLSGGVPRGRPDRMLMRRGKAVFIEFKAPGEDPTSQQLLRHKELRDRGFEVYVIDDLAKGFRLVDAISA